MSYLILARSFLAALLICYTCQVISTFWRAIFLQIVKFNVQEIAIQYNYHSRYAVSYGTVKPMYTAEHACEQQLLIINLEK